MFFIVGLVAVLAVVIYTQVSPAKVLGGGLSNPSCNTETTTRVTVGDDIATTVLATTTNRAYARLQLNNGETNNVYVAFNDAVPSTSLGIPMIASSSLAVLEFGLNTDYPTTGAVKIRTNNSTTTLSLITCNY